MIAIIGNILFVIWRVVAEVWAFLMGGDKE